MSNSPTLPPATAVQQKPTPFPSLKVESDERLQAALTASANAEACLNGLFRSIQNLDSGVGGAKEANHALTHDLEAVRDMLSLANEQQQAFKQKVTLLEQALDRLRKEGDRERTFLIEQQDAFIVSLLDDQEVVLKSRDKDLETLRGRIAELERRTPSGLTPPLAGASASDLDLERAERAELERTAQKLAEDRERARETVHRLQAQRDEAQSAVARISKERDEALQQVHRLKAELGGPRISTRPPSAGRFGDAAPFSLPAVSGGPLSLEALAAAARLPEQHTPSQPSLPVVSASRPIINSVLSPPRSNPNAAPLPTRLSPPPSRLSPPPGEVQRPLSSAAQSSTSSSRPALKQKPDPSTRPLVDYAMGNDSVETEHLESLHASSKPPGNDKR